MLGIHGPVLWGKIANMPERREHPVPAAKIFLDGPRLGGRFNDNQLHFMSSRMCAIVETALDVRQAARPDAGRSKAVSDPRRTVRADARLLPCPQAKDVLAVL